MELSKYVCIRKTNIMAFPENIDFNIGDHVEIFDGPPQFGNISIHNGMQNTQHKSEVIYFRNQMYIVETESFRNNFIHIDIWRGKQLDSVLN
jgi:hypothetical protein